MTGRQAAVAKKSYQETQLMYKYDLNTKLYHEIRVKKNFWHSRVGQENSMLMLEARTG